MGMGVARGFKGDPFSFKIPRLRAHKHSRTHTHTHTHVKEVEAAARAAHAHDFISSFEDGYETMVWNGEREWERDEN